MKSLPSSRLQRPPDFTGQRLETLRSVILRHGLPGALLAIAFLGSATYRRHFETLLQPAFEQPLIHGIGAAVIAGALVFWASRAAGAFHITQLRWVFYLGALSVWEEWVFRAALPVFFNTCGLALGTAVLLSNLIFGAMHYVTLRWRWQWCVGAALGGLALSGRLDHHQNLLLIALLHWVATTINTPLPPGARRVGNGPRASAEPPPPPATP